MGDARRGEGMDGRERAVGGINRGLLAFGLLIRMEMEKWPIEWAGMLWEKMHRAERQQAVAAASSSSSNQKLPVDFQGLDRYQRQAGQDGPVRLG